MESEQDLRVHIGKKYCLDCVKAIRENTRRTVSNVKRLSTALPPNFDPTAVQQQQSESVNPTEIVVVEDKSDTISEAKE